MVTASTPPLLTMCRRWRKKFRQRWMPVGNLVIPSFAVGRTQEMLYFIREIKERNLVTGHDNFPVYIDSPLAIEATRVFMENRLDCFDTAAMELVKKGINPFSSPV